MTGLLSFYRAGTDQLILSRNVSAPSTGGMSINFEVGSFPPGGYDVRILTMASAGDTTAVSAPSEPANFNVEGASESASVTIIGAVSGGVGVTILIVVGILVGAFFLCFYSHR